MTEVCGCVKDPQASIYETCVKCYISDKLDPWHYTGTRAFHSDNESLEFISVCKQKLHRRELPIRIGWTVYVNADRSIFEQSNAWCPDEYGRTVILLDEYLLFQRYTEGDLLMKSKDGIMYDSVTSDDLKLFKREL